MNDVDQLVGLEGTNGIALWTDNITSVPLIRLCSPSAYHPGVVVSVRRIGQRLRLVEKSSRLHLLAKRDKVRFLSLLQTPFLVRPEGAGRSDSGLNLVDDEKDVVLFGDHSELTEKLGRGVLVSSFGQDRLDDHSRDRLV